jgi:hypothetical protein
MLTLSVAPAGRPSARAVGAEALLGSQAVVPKETALAWGEVLGKEFARRDMRTQLRPLREWYTAVKSGRAIAPLYATTSEAGAWTLAFVEQWLGMLRLPPFQDRYLTGEVSKCPSCQERHVQTRVTFPGGALMACGNTFKGCRAAWLVEFPT